MHQYANIVELENAAKRIFFAKFRNDTAKNEPVKKLKNLQEFCKIYKLKFLLILLTLILLTLILLTGKLTDETAEHLARCTQLRSLKFEGCAGLQDRVSELRRRMNY